MTTKLTIDFEHTGEKKIMDAFIERAWPTAFQPAAIARQPVGEKRSQAPRERQEDDRQELTI